MTRAKSVIKVIKGQSKFDRMITNIATKMAFLQREESTKAKRAKQRRGIREGRGGFDQRTSWWDPIAKYWKRSHQMDRFVAFHPNRSRHRRYVEKVQPGEHDRREANWRKSKVGRQTLRRRQHGRVPTVQSAESIREAVEKKRHLTSLRRAAKTGTLDSHLCPYHDLGLEWVEDCTCNREP